MALLKNGTISGGATGTPGYNFPSGSFSHKKQPNMPNDQKAKLLAMHRDGKANAGIYVAVVLIVYFILVIILLCRYGKRRRAPEPSVALESTAEQGRFHLLNFHFGKIASCGEGGDGCMGNLSNLCFGRCQRIDTSSAKPVVAPAQKGTEDEKGMMSKNVNENEMLAQGKGDEGKEEQQSKDEKNLIGKKAEDVERPQDTEDEQHNEDSDESLEDD